MAVGILLLILLCLLGCFIYYWRKNNEEEEYDYKPNNVAEDRCSCAVAALSDDNNYVCRFYGRNRNSFNYSHFNSYVSRPGSSDSLGQDSRLESTPVTVSSRAARRWHTDTRHSSCR